jgi:hypothetical protein
MDYALHPGEVCIPTENPSPQDRPRYGVQMLATCRQVYEEGHEIWYGKNTFRLRSCTASEMRQILGAYQAKHLGMMPTLVIDFTLYDLPLSHQNSLLDTMIATADHTTIATATRNEPYCFARDRFRDDWTEASKNEWFDKMDWLRSEIPKGHRMQISLDRSTYDKLWFDLEGTWMQDGFGLVCYVIEVQLGTTTTSETEMSRAFGNIHEILPEGWSGLGLTQEYEECPGNRKLRDSVRIRGVPHEETMDGQVPNYLRVDA